MISLFCLLVSFLVQSQLDFDRIPAVVQTALERGDSEVNIHLEKGVYFYGDQFLGIKGVDAPGVSLSISGEDAVLVASDGGNRDYSPAKGYVDLQALRHRDVRGPMRNTYFWPMKVPFRKNLYRIRCMETPPDSLGEMSIQLTQWYISVRYPVEKITPTHIYFRRDKKYETGMLSELRFGRCMPRYRLCRAPADTSLYACSAVRFLTVGESTLRSLSLKGLRFLGNGEGDWMIRLAGLTADSVHVTGCRFEGLRSGAVYFEKTDSVLVEGNEFRDCYKSCIYIKSTCRDAVVRGNRFINNGLALSNAPVVNCKGDRFLIQDNYFEDFAYSAIGLGHHYAEKDTCGLRGVVERNEICLSPSFRKGVFASLIDSGAIYVWTKNNGLVIRDNYIHDIDGPHGNRGILCDDGACNVQIYGNRVLRVRRSFCIDLRMFRRVAMMPGSQVRRPNYGNVMHDNIVDGRCRFKVRPSDKTSLSGKNIEW